MTLPVDRIGQKFGRLTVVKREVRWSHRFNRNYTYWICQCDCGKTTMVATGNLTRGTIKSCGCLARELADAKIKHGHSKWKSKESGTYRSWKRMLTRCLNKNTDDYIRWYGGRGIGVCERWRDFRNFLADMGERPEGMTIERINNDGNYGPSNCRWATAKEQADSRGEKIVLKWPVWI